MRGGRGALGHVSLEERGGAHRISLRAALAQQSTTRGRVFGPHRGGQHARLLGLAMLVSEEGRQHHRDAAGQFPARSAVRQRPLDFFVCAAARNGTMA